tara:strand:- start:294 stop:1337 length:1044 start_codon:yes stop_codon:yes gene_type:complete
MNYEKFHNKGLTGLVNLGNTCYINSSLQVLSHVPEFNEYIGTVIGVDKNKNNNDINDIFLSEWYDLYKLIWSKNCIISPNRFLRVIQSTSKQKENGAFIGYDQNDSTEFLYFILQIFHDSLKNHKYSHTLLDKFIKNQHSKSFSTFLRERHKNEYSIIDALFSTYAKIDIVDDETNKVLATNYENFYLLDLAMSMTNSQYSLDNCLKHYFSDEKMNKENDNQYYDDKEKKYKNVTKKVRLMATSKYIVLQLKRWNMNLKKNQRIVHYDNCSIHFKDYLHEDAKENMNHTYELFGIINHSGNVFGGHYFSYIKGFNGKWYEFNDTMVHEISDSKLLSNKNYCFIYRRK